MSEKFCPVCKATKDVAEFPTYFSKQRNKYRIGNYCKPCGRIESKKRVAIYFEKHKEQRLEYARQYRADPKNKEKLKVLSDHFDKKYRKELQPCYLRDVLVQKYGFRNQDLLANPDIVNAYKLQLLIKRKLKENGKK